MSVIVDNKLTVSGAHNAASRLSSTIESSVKDVKEVLVHVEFERPGPDTLIMRPVPLIERDVHRVVAEQCADIVLGVSHVRIHFIQQKVAASHGTSCSPSAAAASRSYSRPAMYRNPNEINSCVRSWK